jgi:hypothetical protein
MFSKHQANHQWQAGWQYVVRELHILGHAMFNCVFMGVKYAVP